MNKIRTITICGPTASGKTYLGVELAKKLNGEIVSADSIQIYKGVDIASAKPDFEEMQGIKHHLIDFVSPVQYFLHCHLHNLVLVGSNPQRTFLTICFRYKHPKRW